MKYLWLPNQTIEYSVLHALESGMESYLGIKNYLNINYGYLLSQRQVMMACYRLEKGVVVVKNGDSLKLVW